MLNVLVNETASSKLEIKMSTEHPRPPSLNDGDEPPLYTGQQESIFSDWVIQLLLASIALTVVLGLLVVVECLQFEHV